MYALKLIKGGVISTLESISNSRVTITILEWLYI